jgi:hypothetical protein
MTDDDNSPFMTSRALHAEARKMRSDAEALLKAANADRVEAERMLGQCDHRRREISQVEQSVAAREKWLKENGEDVMREREAAADAKLMQAQELMNAYDKAKHQAALALAAIDQRDREAAEARKAKAA